MTPFRLAILRDVFAYPGEYAPRRIVFGAVCVCEVPPSIGTNPPTEEDWAKRMREDGLLLPARVRVSAHMTEARLDRMYEGRPKEIVSLVFAAGEEGMAVGELADGGDPSGALERTLEELYRDGRLSPPAALWPSEKGRAVVEGC